MRDATAIRVATASALLRQPIGPVAGALGMDVSAAPANAAADRAGSGVARALLPIHLLRRARHFGAGLGLGRALPQIVLVHDHGVVQQLLADAGANWAGSISYLPTSAPERS